MKRKLDLFGAFLMLCMLLALAWTCVLVFQSYQAGAATGADAGAIFMYILYNGAQPFFTTVILYVLWVFYERGRKFADSFEVDEPDRDQ